VDLPIGVRCLDYDFIFPDIDSNASPAFAFTFGELNADSSSLLARPVCPRRLTRAIINLIRLAPELIAV
jgi:hypothetical protein